MPDQVGSRVKRSPMFWVAVVALGLAAVIRLSAEVIDSTSVWPIVLGACGVAVLVVVVVAAVNAGARARLRHVATRRPDATVVLTVPAVSMVETAARLGADRNGIKPDGSSYAVLAVLPDRVEFWAGKEQAPRWSVPRTPDGVSLVHTPVGVTTTDALRISADAADGAEIVARPVALPLWRDLRGKHRLAAVEQLIRDLGQDPAHVLGSPTTQP